MSTYPLSPKPIKDRTEARRQFLCYVNSVMFYGQRIRNQDGTEPVHIPMNEIKYRFFRPPWFKAIYELKWLKEAGQLQMEEKETKAGKRIYYYKALVNEGINLALLPLRPDTLNDLEKRMRQNLIKADLPKNAPSTDYFNEFLKWKDVRPDLFLLVDSFSGRIHTPVTNFHRSHRPNILLDGMPTTSFDVVTMQPLLLGKILKERIGPNEFSERLDSGEDIYRMLQQKAGFATRDQAKKRFFEILFSKPSNALNKLYGVSPWIQWINCYKASLEAQNPRSKVKLHSNLAWLLQSTEVQLMRKVWHELASRDILFLSVHDEVIVKTQDRDPVQRIFSDILKNEFSYFKLGNKSNN